MVKTAAAVCLLLLLPPGVTAEEEPTAGGTDSWIGKHRDELVLLLGQPSKVRRDPQGDEVLVFRVRWLGRFVPPSEAQTIRLAPKSGGGPSRDDPAFGPSLPAIHVGPTTGGTVRGKKTKLIFYLDRDGHVTRYAVKAKRPKN